MGGSTKVSALVKEQRAILTPRVLLLALGFLAFSLLLTTWGWRRAVHIETAQAQQLLALRAMIPGSAAGTPGAVLAQTGSGGRLSRLILISGVLRSLAMFVVIFALLLARNLAASRRQALAEVEAAGLLHKVEQEQLRLAAKVFANCSEGICITDAENRILTVNPAFIRMTGYTQEELLGQDPKVLASHREDPAFYENMWDALLTLGHWQGQIWDRRKTGEVYPKWLHIDTVKDASGEIVNFVAVASDITERLAAEEHLRFNAEHDALTGLPNRALFADRFLQAAARAKREERRIGLLFLDLDHFKEINDTYGHAAGDGLLQQLAGRLSAEVRASDTVTRLGGDEFLVMLPDLEQATEIAPIAEKLLEAVRQPYALAGQLLPMTFSVGGCCYPEQGTALEELVRCADLAMYAAKAGGRNQSRFYSPAMEPG